MAGTAIAYEQSGAVGVVGIEQIIVGTQAVQFPYYKCLRVMVKSDSSNTGNIYIGINNQVSSNTGFQIIPNGGLSFSATRTDKFWLIASLANQKVELIFSNDPGGFSYSGGTNPTSGASNVNISDIGGVAVTEQNLNIQLSSVSSFQQASTSTAAALASHACNVCLIKNDDASAISLYVGGPGVTTSTGLQLKAGQGISINVANTNLIYIVASSTTATADVIYG